MAIRGNVFGSIPVGKIGRTNFNLSHQLTGNYKEGLCYPVFLEETIPGDSWTINTYNISKLETLIAPAMQRTRASLIWMKIPKRLCMKNFKNWYSGGTDGTNSSEKPYTTFQSIVDCFLFWQQLEDLTEGQINQLTDFFFGPGSLWQNVGLPIPYDYSGDSPQLIPPIVYSDAQSKWIVNWNSSILEQKIDLIPFNAYALCYMEYFRDQTLSNPIFEDNGTDFPSMNLQWKYIFHFTGDYSGTMTLQVPFIMNSFESGLKAFSCVFPLFILFRRAWDKDYYTSALPEPQRGPEVTIGITDDSAPVSVTGSGSFKLRGENVSDDDSMSDSEGDASYYNINDENIHGYNLQGRFDSGGYVNMAFKEVDGLSADLSGLSPITITAFRNLFKLQQFLEKNNIAGGRFIEFILAHWAERVPDFTVQRPQFVRATSIPVIVSEVTATANSAGVNSQLGDQAGRAKGQGNIGRCHIYTQEPSIIIGFYSVTPPPSYIGQGIPKKFQRMTRWDEPYPEFQHIGEQAILEKELYIAFNDTGVPYDPESEFGYQQRYSEFKYLPDRVVGDFATSLSYWNQARIFKGVPHLNQDFIENNPSERIFAVEGERPVIADFWFDIKCKRKLSKFSTPKLN